MKYELNDVDFVLVCDALNYMSGDTASMKVIDHCDAVVSLLRSQRNAQSNTEADPNENTWVIEHNLNAGTNVEVFLNHKRISVPFVHVDPNTIQMTFPYSGTYKVNCFAGSRMYQTSITVEAPEEPLTDDERLELLESCFMMQLDATEAILTRLETLENIFNEHRHEIVPMAANTGLPEVKETIS